MKTTLVAIAAFLGLVVGAVSATGTAANAHESVHVGIGFGFGYGYGGYPYGGGYPNNYYPNYYYPYEYYTPHAPHYDYPYYHPYYYPFYDVHPSYLVCNTIITTRVYWRNHRKYLVQVPVRSCYRARAYER